MKVGGRNGRRAQAAAADSRSTEDLWVGHEVGSRPGMGAEGSLGAEEEKDNLYEAECGLSRVHHYHEVFCDRRSQYKVHQV